MSVHRALTLPCIPDLKQGLLQQSCPSPEGQHKPSPSTAFSTSHCLDISLPSVLFVQGSVLFVQGKGVARPHRTPMAAPIHTQQMLRHMLTWPQLQPQQHSTPFHTRFTPRPHQAAAPTRPPWKPPQSTLETSLLGQEVKAASRSGARGLQPPRAHRLGQTAAMVTTRPMHPSQGMGITPSMGTMLTMRWGLCMAKPRSRLCTGRKSRMTRVLA